MDSWRVLNPAAEAWQRAKYNRSRISQAQQNMKFSEQALSPINVKLQGTNKLWVAYSGGLDSHVLLSALSKILPSASLRALHIHHGLSPNADRWEAHCQQVCTELGITFETHRVEIDQGSSSSLEKLAREARYAVFKQCVGTDDYLLMGHHQNDQLETILYRLMRGSGPRGLGGMPAQRSLGLGSGQILRPLLNYSREALEEYAKSEGLAWVEDESNQDTHFDRNFLRSKIFPLLKERWPGFEQCWQRSASLCTEAEHLQIVLGEQDLLLAQTEYLNRVNIAAIKNFDEIRQRNLLRVWFRKLEQKCLVPQPDYHSLQRILKEVIAAEEDAEPLVSWSNSNEAGNEKIEIRRFGGELYVLRSSREEEPPLKALEWKPAQTPVLTLNPSGLYPETLQLEKVASVGIDLTDLSEFRISFRQGGEQAKPAGRKTRSLKKLFQDYGVPPWLRERIPLIYSGDELVAVGDLFICENWQCEKGQKLYRFNWENKVLSGNL